MPYSRVSGTPSQRFFLGQEADVPWLFHKISTIARRFPCFLILIFLILGASTRAAQQAWENQVQESFQKGLWQEARQQAEEAIKDPVTAPLAHEWLGRIALEEKHPQEALSHFQEAGAKDRLNPELAKGWAESLMSLDRAAEASALLEKALLQTPGSTELQYRLASAYLMQGLPLKAQPILEEAYQRGLRNVVVVMSLAQARFLSGRDDQAVLLLESPFEGDSSPPVLLDAGKILFEHALYLKAITPLEKAWKLQPGSYDIGMYLALSYSMSGQYQEADGVLSQIQTEASPSLELLLLQGSTRARLGKWDEAERLLNQALKSYPNQAGAYLNLGLFYLERHQDEKAMSLIEKGAQYMTKGTKLLYSIGSMENCEGLSPPLEVKKQDTARGKFYNDLGRALHENGQNGSALAVYLLAVQNDNLNTHAYAEIGRLCWEADHVEVARRFLLRGLEVNQDSWELHFNMGLLYQSLSQLENAVRSYEKAIALEKDHAQALHWVQLGTAQFGTPKLGEAAAEHSFRKALEIDPNSPQAHYQLGKLYLQQKDYSKAEQFLERAIALDPSLVRAYYQYGMACIRNGKAEKGKEMLETFNRKRSLRTMPGMGGMQAEPMSEKILQ